MHELPFCPMVKLRENSLSTQAKLTLHSHFSGKTQLLLMYYSRQTKVITHVLAGCYSDDSKAFLFTDYSEMTHEIPMLPNPPGTQCTPVHCSAPEVAVSGPSSSSLYRANEKHHKRALIYLLVPNAQYKKTRRHIDTYYTSPTLAGSIFRSNIAFNDVATATRIRLAFGDER